MMCATIQQTLATAAKVLTELLPEGKLDAELLLAYVLKKDRSYLHAWPEKIIAAEDLQTFQALIDRRVQHEPVAYIIGEKEFWSLPFCVNPQVLIPRPETELLVEAVLDLLPKEENVLVADLGTGSGAIAIALAKERPHWKIYASDVDEHALQIAKKNAERLGIENICFVQGDWCQALPNLHFDAIISNPPYVSIDEKLDHSLSFEPKTALFAEQNGLADYLKIIKEVKKYLKPNAYLCLEHGASQATEIQSILEKTNLKPITLLNDLAGLPRVTIASRMEL